MERRARDARAREARVLENVTRRGVARGGVSEIFGFLVCVRGRARARAASRAAPRELRYFLGISPREVVVLPERHMHIVFADDFMYFHIHSGFEDSVAGKSNWNAYEGSSEKVLTKEELAAKNKAEDEAAAARRAASAKKMAEERKKAGM